jgi:monofunctional glycosyltransferase
MINKLWKILFKILLLFFCLTIILIIIFRFLPIPTSSFMIQKKISDVFNGKSETIQYIWVSQDDISKSIKLAVIASEDQKFFDHFGFDIESIEKAIKQNKRRRITRGASTITQQTAKNLFLWSGKSFIRKGLEAYFTILLELFWSKERILEVYLNIAEFGENVYGVQAASEKFFKRNANQLTNLNAAMLAAVLPNPKRYKVNSPTSYQQRRIFWIQKQMLQLGFDIINNN